jgi:hypothetical protein
MIKPAAFGFNDQTAENNFFQNKIFKSNLQETALKEFNDMVLLLKGKGVEVIVLEDNVKPIKPDAIFPNNWFSCKNGVINIFPMYAQNRRMEKRSELIDHLKSITGITKINDYSDYENNEQFLEGTGSMVFDHKNKIAYACISARTNELLFKDFANQHNYLPFVFTADDEAGREIYHTNVLMCIGIGFAVVCINAIKKTEKYLFIEQLEKTNHEIIDISFKQMKCFAGNMLELVNKDGAHFLLMSKTAYNSLAPLQIKQLEKFCNFIVPDVSTIEITSGGSVRCMVAEIFN